MSIPALPDWLPWWVPILVLVPALLWALAFLFMPFGVFGVKGRLEAIEARLDEIQGEIRSLALRMPEPVHHAHYDESIYEPPPAAAPPRARADAPPARPPIPPAPYDFAAEDREEMARLNRRAERNDPARTPRSSRHEPRIDWPR